MGEGVRLSGPSGWNRWVCSGGSALAGLVSTNTNRRYLGGLLRFPRDLVSGEEAFPARQPTPTRIQRRNTKTTALCPRRWPEAGLNRTRPVRQLEYRTVPPCEVSTGRAA